MFTYDQIKKTEDIDLEDLGFSAIDVTPQDADWQQGYPEEWQYWEACRSDPDYQDVEEGVLVYPDDQNKVDRLYEYCEGPMMNYVYELDDLTWGRFGFHSSIQEAAAHLYDLPLCIIEFYNGPIDYGLALTGGGMDFSWEICEAYMRLGHVPPVHFADLPRMGGRGESEADRKIIGACKKSFERQSQQSNQGIDSLEKNFG